MKINLLCAALLSLLCGFASNVSAQSSAFTVRGSVDGGLNGDTLILGSLSGRSNVTPLDTAVFRNGTFEFKGNTDGAHVLVILGFRKGNLFYGGDFIVEPGEIWVRIPKDQSKDIEVPKNVTNALWRSFVMYDKEVVNQIQPYAKAYQTQRLSPADKKMCETKLDSLTTIRAANIVSFVTKNSKTSVADLVFSMYYSLLNDKDFESVSSLLAQNNPQLPGYVSAMAKHEAEAKAKQLSAGGKFIDFEMQDTNGKILKISDVVAKNKLTLIDFWASWCGPCRAEMTTVKRAYDFFHSKGLEIVGVSLDGNRDSWLNAISSMGLNWLHVSDLKGWQCSAAQTYQVHSIPSSLLVDQEGNIVAKDLRGEQLIQVLLKKLN